MKIEFKNDKEKETLSHILVDWFMHNGDDDVLGCQPCCRNPQSSGCEQCIKEMVDCQLDRNELEFWCYGGEDWIQKNDISKFLKLNNPMVTIQKQKELVKQLEEAIKNNPIIAVMNDNKTFGIPEACKYCSNHPTNGGSGICNCTMGLPKITC